MNFKLFFQGKVSYPMSFWVYYMLIGTIASFPSFLGDAIWAKYELILTLYSFVQIAFIIFLMIGAWRSANVYKENQRKKKLGTIWGTLGQVYIGLSIIRIIATFITGFGQL